MDILKGRAPDNYNEMRGRTLLQKSNIFRNTSISFTISAKLYHKRMTWNNDMDVDDNDNNKDTSSELFYETSQEKVIHLSMAAEKQADTLSLKDNLTNDSSSVKFTNGGLSFFLFYFLFLFFYFSIFRTTRVKVDRSRCHISHNLMM